MPWQETLRTFGALMLGALAMAVTPALADNGSRLESGEIVTRLVPGPAKYTVLLPPGYDASGTIYPLLCCCMAAMGDNVFLKNLRRTIEAAWAAGDLPPLVVLTPDAQRSLYMDYKDGSQRWETFIVTELLNHVRKTYRVSPDRSKTVVSGISMGGLGSLRLGFDHPEIFGGLAALEAGIEPALSFDAIKVRNSFQRSPSFFAERFGTPVDGAYWKTFNPANIAIMRRDEIVRSGLQIYIEVGDADMFHLDEGNEFLHRVLWDHGIAHEYRLVHGADHLGRTLPGRLRDGFRFLNAHVLNPLPPDNSYAAGAALVKGLKTTRGVDDSLARPPLPSTGP
jgi:S-formylglutathione hydrolase